MVSLSDKGYQSCQKRVRWAVTLEQIRFYTPENKSDAPAESLLKRLKIKMHAWKEKRLASLLIITQEDLQRLHEQIEIIVGKITGHCDEINIENLTDDHRDEILQLYEVYQQTEEKTICKM